jgi:periplasmic divalent cation tolerance protein
LRLAYLYGLLAQSKVDITNMKLIEIHTTVATIEDANQIATLLVAQKLVACAQITEIKSYYFWDAALQASAEFRISFKSIDANYAAVERAIRERHPYTLPAIYAVPVEQVSEAYKQWVIENSAGV